MYPLAVRGAPIKLDPGRETIDRYGPLMIAYLWSFTL
jgi:hypothetical protein